MKDLIIVVLATIAFILTLFIVATGLNSAAVVSITGVALSTAATLIAPILAAFVVMYILTRSDKNYLTVK